MSYLDELNARIHELEVDRTKVKLAIQKEEQELVRVVLDNSLKRIKE